MFKTEENYHEGSDTEQAGAIKGAQKAPSIRARIVELLTVRPMTDEELSTEWESKYGKQSHGFAYNTLRRRRHELKQAGLVADTGERRRSTCGTPNVVWGPSPTPA